MLHSFSMNVNEEFRYHIKTVNIGMLCLQDLEGEYKRIEMQRQSIRKQKVWWINHVLGHSCSCNVILVRPILLFHILAVKNDIVKGV